MLRQILLILFFLRRDTRESLQSLPSFLPSHGRFPGAPLRVEASHRGGFGHRRDSNLRGGDEHLTRRLIDAIGCIRVEVGEVRVSAGGAEENRGGGIDGGGEGAGAVGDGGAAEAHEAEVGRKGIVVDLEADRAEEAWVVVEDAVGAVASVVGAVVDGEEREVLDGAAAAARGGGGGGRREVHCDRSGGIWGRKEIPAEWSVVPNGNPRNEE